MRIIGQDDNYDNTKSGYLNIYKYDQSKAVNDRMVFETRNQLQNNFPYKYVQFSKGGNYIFEYNFSANTLYIYEFDKSSATMTMYDSVYVVVSKAMETNVTDDFLYFLREMPYIKRTNEIFLMQYNLQTKESVIVDFMLPVKYVNDDPDFVYDGMELAADNKIYINAGFKNSLHSIAYPDELCSADGTNECGLNLNTFVLQKNDQINYHTSNGFPELIVDSNELYMDTFRFAFNQCDSFRVSAVAYGPHKCATHGKTMYSQEAFFLFEDIDEVHDTISLTIRGKTVNKKIPWQRLVSENGLVKDNLNSSGNLTLYADSSFYNFPYYNWYKDGVHILSACNCRYLTVTGNYTVEGVTLCAKRMMSNPVKVKQSCTKIFENNYYRFGTVFPTGPTNITSSPADSTYTMGNTITVPAGAYVNIENVKINMLPCAEIIQQQAKLDAQARQLAEQAKKQAGLEEKLNLLLTK